MPNEFILSRIHSSPHPGLRKSDKLQRNIVTPTTKAKEGDVPVSADEVRGVEGGKGGKGM